MIIKLKVEDIMKLDLWEEYCQQSGTSLYAVSEGMDEDEFVSLNINSSKSIIILKEKK